MKRPHGMLLMVLLIAPLPAWAASAKNIVMFVSDDHGLDTGCYGNPAIKTPNLDSLAAEGTWFNYAFCTTASCSASRSVILTGLYNHANAQFGHQHRYHHFRTYDWVKSLPVLLTAAGYRTCSIGKFHVGPEPVYHFERYDNKGIPGGSRNPVKIAERAERFIREIDDRPFFIYMCTSDPHRSGKGFANGKDYPGVEKVVYRPQDVLVPQFLPDEPEVRAELAEYYQSVSRVDQGIGRLLRALKDTGHWDDTLILYLSDNGIAFPGAKTNLYDPGMRLPLIVRSPSQSTRGLVTNAMVTWADLTPTILDYAGVKGPEYPLHGKSFLPVLEETDPGGWDEVYASHTFHEITMYYPMRVIRTRQYKYILNLAHPLPFPFASDLYDSPTWQGVLQRGDKMFGSRTVDAYIHRPRHELYDLQADPNEVVNLADHPDHQATLTELQGKLRQWQTKTKDPWIVKYKYE